jgi:cholesterol transport system auxiliary component
MNPVYRFRHSTLFTLSWGKSIQWLAVAGITLMSAGCSILPPSSPQRVYQLPGATTPSAQATIPSETMPSLRVSTPSSPMILASSRILVMNAPNELAAFKGVRWSDPMPRLFQQRLVNYLRDSNDWQSVSTDDAPVASNYQLILSLAQFHAVRMPKRAPGVEVRVNATLINRKENETIASQTFLETAHSDSASFDDLLTAYGRAANTIAAKISEWAQHQIGQR